MKKILAIIAVLLVVGIQAHASTANTAVVIFSNDFGAVGAPVYDVGGTTPLAGAGYTVGIFAGTSANNLQLVTSVLFTSNTGGDGYFYGGNVDLSSAGISPGGVATIQVEVWQTSAGSFANSTVRGISNVFTQTTSDQTQVPAVPQTALLGMTAVTLQNVAPVPEPSVLALGALGGLALLIRRRK